MIRTSSIPNVLSHREQSHSNRSAHQDRASKRPTETSLSGNYHQSQRDASHLITLWCERSSSTPIYDISVPPRRFLVSMIYHMPSILTFLQFQMYALGIFRQISTGSSSTLKLRKTTNVVADHHPTSKQLTIAVVNTTRQSRLLSKCHSLPFSLDY